MLLSVSLLHSLKNHTKFCKWLKFNKFLLAGQEERKRRRRKRKKRRERKERRKRGRRERREEGRMGGIEDRRFKKEGEKGRLVRVCPSKENHFLRCSVTVSRFLVPHSVTAFCQRPVFSLDEHDRGHHVLRKNMRLDEDKSTFNPGTTITSW